MNVEFFSFFDITDTKIIMEEMYKKKIKACIISIHGIL